MSVLASRAYRAAHPEKVAAYQRAYRAANREKVAERKRAYYEANREKWRTAYRAARRKQPRQTPSDSSRMTPADWLAVQKSVQFHWCKAQQADKSPEKPKPQ